MPSANFDGKTTTVDFRIRFKVAHIAKLAKLDINTYNYYFHQARNDVLENKIPDVLYEKYRRELVGLGITDMYRVMLEKDIPRGSVENEYKKYIPKEVLRRHSFFIKKPIHDTLGKLQKSVHDASYVKAEYLKQLENIAPEYLSETYKAVLEQDGDACNVILTLSPHDSAKPGLKYYMEGKKRSTMATDLRDRGSQRDIDQQPGQCRDIALLDGYYRLTCKWTFNICSQVETPSLRSLHAMKCHGPVGGEFSYAKLEAKRANKAGCFIIRESESKYNNYFIDVCLKDGLKPKTFKLEKITGDEFIFNDDLTRYKNIHQLMASYNDPNGAIWLKECLPPSEYDDSPLLLCKSETMIGDSLTDSTTLNVLLPTSPMCINCKDLQVYKVFPIKAIIISLKLFSLAILVLSERPPGNLTDLTICKVSHLGLEYLGQVSKSESRVRCQSWEADKPHKVAESITNSVFPDGSKKNAKNYCRNPTRDSMGPWCYTMNDDLKFETCGLPLCALSECKITGPGMEYAGQHNRGASDKKCLKWNKDRNKVKHDGNYIKLPKFDKTRFPENNLGDAKKFCRNPNGDTGGPWCFVENEDTNQIEIEYCDIPFCDDPDCMVFTKSSDTYMHYTDFNDTLANLTFGVKLWDPDSYLEATARLVLSVIPLPLTGKEIEDLGVGIEIVIGNNFSSLRFGNKDKPEYEPTNGVLKSTEFTKFSLSWHAGFITFGLEGQIKPIFLAEYKTKKNLLGFKMNKFNYYSAQGTNVLWNFPFCEDDFDCDVHTTTGKEFQQFWPLREGAVGRDLYVHVRAFRSAGILIVPSPTVDYPNVKIMFLGANNFTKITTVEYLGGPERVLKELQLYDILDYWEWREFSISFFANSMRILMKKPAGMQKLAELTSDIFRNMRWFSVSSDNTVAHWSFFCIPPDFSNPPPALLPECALNEKEPEYKGTQDITSEGLPCLPWSGKKLLGDNVEAMFTNESTLKAWNYCRDPSGDYEGTYCYAISLAPEKKIEKTYCRLRKCKSEQCKMAGTGNDYIGTVSVTRSNKTCDVWYFTNYSTHAPYMKAWNETLFADLSAEKAKNYCRNPSRDLSGSWCYTTNPNVLFDVCNVRDCDKPEECTIVTGKFGPGRSVYILPQWKEAGIHGGLRFSIKQWNPDEIDGLHILIQPKAGSDNIVLQIGAENNEKIILYYNNQVVEQKTFPHLISTGKWTDLWLQMRQGEIMLGFEGVPTSLFEWKSENPKSKLDPVFLNFGSIAGNPLGLFFKCDECHTEFTTTDSFQRCLPIGMWSTKELPIYNNLTLRIRGSGVAFVSFLAMPGTRNFIMLKIDTLRGEIALSDVTGGLSSVLIYANVKELISSTNWTRYDITFNETDMGIARDNETVLYYKSAKPMMMYWFVLGVREGWMIWTANCEPLDLDGPPRDGGWSRWSPLDLHGLLRGRGGVPHEDVFESAAQRVRKPLPGFPHVHREV
ncbi:hypothetical protein NQ318_014170 [Aromia moschata]|uniref:Uncharacterized protein n=1 Tax=Aromia moschata TaxID=1265417 RepID=A0AAV8Y909_9CUCU|nr:hypothetical protein NQ318_014170 [Aromia moschata]